MNLMVNPVITDFQQDVNGDIKMLKLGANKEDAYANIIGQAESADLENNKAATINVSTYTEPVEITPTEGKDGMKKATITLSNIPSPSPATSVTFYCWTNNDYGMVYTLSATPSVADYIYPRGYSEGEIALVGDVETVEEVGEGTITNSNGYTYTRNSEDDIVANKSSS